MIALHGFLGSARDFAPFATEFKKWSPGTELFILNLFSHGAKYLPEGGFARFSAAFLDQAPRNACTLLGYSFGGRLALQLAIDHPERFQNVILVSANPGLMTAEEKRERLQNDLIWAERFASAPWLEVVRDWNAQGVFSGSTEPARYEGDYDRTLLVRALKEYSLAEMSVTPEKLARVPNIHWVCGDKDAKYVTLYSHLRESRVIKNLTILPQAGHRVIFDNPRGLADVVAHLKL